MRNSLAHHALVFATALAFVALTNVPSRAQSTAFTYQGSLDDGGAPAGGLHDFQFRLYSVASGGVPIGSTLCVDNVSVVEGVFTVQLDFGQQYATTAQRHLEIEVRTDTGLNCTNTAGFVVMLPRQQITATPMASHAKSAFALDAADGSPANAVFVDNSGNVGVGTSSPGGKLDIQGSDNANILFGRRTGGGLTHNLFIDAAGNGSLQLRDGAGATRVNVASGDFTYFDYGNVGIGTQTPAAKLDVRGDIRLGPSGQLLAIGGEENLRIIRGSVDTDGVKVGGSGFTVAKTATGRYTVTFTQAFPEIPTVTATTVWGINLSDIIALEQITTTTVRFAVTNPVVEGSVDTGFHFTAIGPR